MQPVSDTTRRVQITLRINLIGDRRHIPFKVRRDCLPTREVNRAKLQGTIEIAAIAHRVMSMSLLRSRNY
jgi:hypothetical protein